MLGLLLFVVVFDIICGYMLRTVLGLLSSFSSQGSQAASLCRPVAYRLRRMKESHSRRPTGLSQPGSEMPEFSLVGEGQQGPETLGTIL